MASTASPCRTTSGPRPCECSPSARRVDLAGRRSIVIQPLSANDAPALTAFSCSRINEPWTEVVEATVRQDLAGQIASDQVSAVGIFDHHGALRGLAAWRIYESDPVLCRGDIVAVATGAQRRGYGRTLKEAVLEAARAAGAVAVSSIVDRRNVPMMRLNQTLGGVVEDMPDDPNHCRWVIRLGQ